MDDLIDLDNASELKLALMIKTQGSDVIFAVKVVPGASITKVAGLLGEALKVTVASAPEKGKANKALEAHLAKLFKCSKSMVTVVAGMTNPQKQVQVSDMDVKTLKGHLAQWL